MVLLHTSYTPVGPALLPSLSPVLYLLAMLLIPNFVT